jgi:hypothetical protein
MTTNNDNDINNYLNMNEDEFLQATQQQISPREQRLDYTSRFETTGNTRLSLGHPVRQAYRRSTPSSWNSSPKDTRHGGKKTKKSRKYKKSRKSKKTKKSRKSKKSKKSRTI